MPPDGAAFEELAAANPSHKWVKVNVDEIPATAAASRSSRSRPSWSWRSARRRSASPAPSRRVASPPSSGSASRLIAQLVDVTYAPGSAPLLAGVTLAVHERTKLGVVGPERERQDDAPAVARGELRPTAARSCASRASLLGRVAQDDRELLALDPTWRTRSTARDAELQLERLAGGCAARHASRARLRELELAYDDALAALSAAHEPDRR